MEMELKKLNVQDGDVLVVKVKESASPDELMNLRKTIRELFEKESKNV